MSKGNSAEQFNQGLAEFLDASPTPFHAVKSMAERLAVRRVY